MTDPIALLRGMRKIGPKSAVRYTNVYRAAYNAALSDVEERLRGYAVVPIEPTEEMLVQGLIILVDALKSGQSTSDLNKKISVRTANACELVRNSGEVMKVYKAMLEAARKEG